LALSRLAENLRDFGQGLGPRARRFMARPIRNAGWPITSEQWQRLWGRQRHRGLGKWCQSGVNGRPERVVVAVMAALWWGTSLRRQKRRDEPGASGLGSADLPGCRVVDALSLSQSPVSPRSLDDSHLTGFFGSCRRAPRLGPDAEGTEHSEPSHALCRSSRLDRIRRSRLRDAARRRGPWLRFL